MTKKPEIIDARKQPISSQAIIAMNELNIEPTPENYATWHHHLSGTKPALSKEIDTLKQAKTEFNEITNKRLYEEYVKTEPSAEATQSVNAAMAKLMAMIGKFSNDADAYNTELGKKTDSLSDTIDGDANLEGLLGEVVGQLKDIQANSTDFSSQIKDSQREITELREDLEKATSEARIDGLTKLNNRRAFDELIEQQTLHASQEREDLCLLMLDIDHFKKFNDTWGHQIGDEVLKVVAGALKRTVRGQDVVARYGGEEFAVLLPETPTNGAHIVAENIRKLIANNRLKRKNSDEELGQITVSIGVTRYRDSDKNESIENFIKRADDALYSAKENGRNRVSLEL